jgi:hypothetical protein
LSRFRTASARGSDTNRDKESTMSKTFKPGTPAPASGQYKNPGTGTEVTGVKGKPLPPTPLPGQGYKLVDPTKHKR